MGGKLIKSRIDYLISFGLPLVCVVASGFINLILVQAGLIDKAALDPKLPTVLDVSLQLVFITVGAIVTMSNTGDSGLQARILSPMILCFFALCFILGLQAMSTVTTWPWVNKWQIILRVVGPDVIGAGTIGFTIWNLRTT